MKEDDRIITAGLRAGQHLCHIQANNALHASKSTIYRNFHRGYYSASVMELPRLVKFKARNAAHTAYVPAGIKVGRSYDDFCAFMQTELFVIIFIVFVIAVFILTLRQLKKASGEDRPVNEVTIDAQ